ncbi:probable pectinesterase/pectinesterase inhibitor 51 [Ipomoea triloba]|uniref:probable pectinesterase/pectinesterase inhibitor 51 n=1 Tax=Ipomoea triloba TaxID=35885 RepID=UPI00125E0644|nr:probable pectinesterase/pectinesterase inhibitor 51 [Ipomoea triloba]
MGSILSLALLTLFLLSASSSSSVIRRYLPEDSATPANIVAACNASRDPALCERALTQSGQLPPNATALQILQSVLNLTFQHLDTAESQVKDILAGSTGNLNRTQAANNSLEAIGYSRYRVGLTDRYGLDGDKMKDGRAWLSAGLAFQYGSWSAFSLVNDTAQVVNTMAFINDTLIPMTSAGLSMLANYDVYGENTALWGPPKTERNGYWEPADKSGLDFEGGVPKGLNPNVTVCNGGGCDYKTVQEAVDAAPDSKPTERFVIWIKAGVYNETVRVPLYKFNVVFLGDGIGKTVITGSLKVGQPLMTTYESATVGVLGDGFMASNLTFENTGTGSQAVAFRSDSDHTVVETCEFRGNQDTLYAKSMRQYYKSCRIQGNVDFIFGNAAAFFKDSEILVVPRAVDPEKGENNAVTAHGRIDPAQTTGFVFHNCTVNGTQEYLKLYYKNPKVHKNFLGRPWKEYSRTVFIGSRFEVIVSKEGWLPWKDDFALNTLYYGELENTGGGGSTAGRVNWSSIIPVEHVNSYSVHNFIQGDGDGDGWIPPPKSS